MHRDDCPGFFCNTLLNPFRVHTARFRIDIDQYGHSPHQFDRRNRCNSSMRYGDHFLTREYAACLQGKTNGLRAVGHPYTVTDPMKIGKFSLKTCHLFSQDIPAALEHPSYRRSNRRFVFLVVLPWACNRNACISHCLDPNNTARTAHRTQALYSGHLQGRFLASTGKYP